MAKGGAETLRGKLILIVEDEYLIAQDLALTLRAAGAEVLGPAASHAGAAALIEKTKPDLALLNIRLTRSETAFALADSLEQAGVPFLFVSGYDGSAMPERFKARPRLEKPVQSDVLLKAVRALLDAQIPPVQEGLE